MSTGIKTVVKADHDSRTASGDVSARFKGDHPIGSVMRRMRRYGIVAAFLALFVTLAVGVDVFLTSRNLLNILSQQSHILIIAVAGTLVLIAGGFDLSVGAVFALSTVVSAQAAMDGGMGAAFVAAAVVGAGVGLVNGLLATVGRINSIIATLATSFIVRGLAVVLTGGLLVSVDRDDFTALGRGSILGVKWSIVVMVVFVIASVVILRRTKFGRYIFAAGGNPEAARLSGIRVPVIQIAAFTLSGFAAALGGLIVASRIATGQADAGVGLEFTVIAGIVVGGTSIQGGEGAVWRTVLGVLLIALIHNGFNLLGLDPIYRQIVEGAIIITAVAADAWSRQAPQ